MTIGVVELTRASGKSLGRKLNDRASPVSTGVSSRSQRPTTMTTSLLVRDTGAGSGSAIVTNTHRDQDPNGSREG
jgi:hypothetical protein